MLREESLLSLFRICLVVNAVVGWGLKSYWLCGVGRGQKWLWAERGGMSWHRFDDGMSQGPFLAAQRMKCPFQLKLHKSSELRARHFAPTHALHLLPTRDLAVT